MPEIDPLIVKEAFLECIQATSEGHRARLLRQLQQNSPACALEVQRMLECKENASFLDQPVFDVGMEVASDSATQTASRASGTSPGGSLDAIETPPSQIGPYRIRECLGEGGMGVVYAADQSEPVRRRVAIKLIKPGMDSSQVIARFQAERQAMAMMNHPNIAKAIDAGTTEKRRPYFVMELICGIPLTTYADRCNLTVHKRLELFFDVCSAIQHAHNNGIIHRDIKPNNVLVTEIDGAPLVKVIDFGIAKALTGRLTDHSVYTGVFQMMGTALYMSPEQASLSHLDVDTRSDVYSLGVMLYELVTGLLPIDREQVKEMNPDQLRSHINQYEPQRPSQRLSTVKDELETIAERRGLEASQIGRLVRGELDWIIMRAIENDRRRRYQSPRDLAEDVQRYLDGDEVEACPPSVAYRTRKLFKRNRGLVVTVGCVLLTALVGSIVSLQYARRSSDLAGKATKAQNQAEELAEAYKSLMVAAEKNADEASDASLRASEAANKASAARDREVTERRRAEKALYLADTRLAASQVRADRHSEAMESLLNQIPGSPEDEMRDWEWYYLLGQANQSDFSWKASNAPVVAIDWSPDGESIAVASYDGSCSVWDRRSGTLQHSWKLGGCIATCVRWSPDGRYLAWGTASDDQKVRIWDRETDSITAIKTTADSVWSVQWSHDQTRLLVGSIQGSSNPDDIDNLFVYERQRDRWELIWKDAIPKNVTYADWNHDESRIAVVAQNKSLRFYDVRSLETTDTRSSMGSVEQGDFAEATNRLAVSHGYGECFVYDLQENVDVASFRAHFTGFSVRWSPDEKWLATSGIDGFVKIWDTSDWSLHQTFSGHFGRAYDVAWSPDSNSLVSCGSDGQIHIWDLNETDEHIELLAEAWGWQTFVWADDTTIEYLHGHREIAEWNLTNQETRTIRELKPAEPSWSLQDRGLAVLRSASNEIIAWSDPRWDSGSLGRQATALLADAPSFSLAIQPTDRSQPVILNLSSGEIVKIGSNAIFRCQQFAWSPESRYLGIVGKGVLTDDGTPMHAGWLYVVDRVSGKLLHRQQVGPSREQATAIAWSPDESLLAAATADGICEVFERDGLIRQLSRSKHLAAVRTLDWHPDGHRIASAGSDGTVQVWDSTTGETLVTFSLESQVQQIAWSPDGSKLGAVANGIIRVWDSQPGRDYVESKPFASRLAVRSRIRFDEALRARDWERALFLSDSVLKDDPNDLQGCYQIALLDSFVGRSQDATRLCLRVADQFSSTNDANGRFFATWTCALVPNCLDSYDKALTVIRQAVDEDPENQKYMACLGAMLLRAGDYAAAKEVLEAAIDIEASKLTSATYALYLMAMSQWHLGEREAAVVTLALANRKAEVELTGSIRWNRELTIRILQREAERLITP